jgi:hypothetical protein
MSADVSLLRVGPIVEARANARTCALHRRLRHRGRHHRHGRRHSRRHRVRHRRSHRRFVLRGRRRRVLSSAFAVLVLRSSSFLAVVLSSECRPVLPRLILPRLGGAGSSSAGPGWRARAGRGAGHAPSAGRGAGHRFVRARHSMDPAGARAGARGKARGPRMRAEITRRCARARMCAEDARARACRRASMLSTRLARVARTPS